MRHLRLIETAACGALLFAALAPRTVLADEWNKKTDVHFSGAVRVPGMTLQGGDYVFKLLDSPSDRYIVQIFNKTEQHLYTTVLAIPDYKVTPPDKALFTFYEAPADQPPPIKSFFYPGDNYGREFVYKKGEAALIASASHETVTTNEAPVATAENTQPVQATEQSTEETAEATEPSTAVTPEAPETTPEESTEQEPAQQPATTPAPPAEPATMPSTASEWPLAGLLGLFSLAGAVVVRAARKA